uniref:Uncharacterized protein n=1 Tax=Anguilla anguilla TaxID=7936 RepID=A0A0E9PZ24_ANGAN
MSLPRPCGATKLPGSYSTQAQPSKHMTAYL